MCSKAQATQFAPTAQLLHSRNFVSTSAARKQNTLLEDSGNGLAFIRSNPRTPKPRLHGVTEVRGPYYSAYGKRHLQDLMDTMGHHIDGLKFAGGSFSLFPEKAVREMIDIAHENEVYVSTVGSFILDYNHLLILVSGRIHGTLTDPS